MGIREVVGRKTDRGREPGDVLPVVGVVQSFLLSAFFLRGVFAPGYPLHSDLITPLSFTPSFFSRFVYAWDPVTGSFSYNTPKLTLQAANAALSALGMGSALVYKLVLVFVLGLTGATMFRLLYARTVGFAGPWRAYTAATLGSLLFVMNPWVINKIHHHFWLVLGYALLPVIYGLYTAALDGRDGLPVLLALALAFAAEATQPHSVFIYVLPLLAVTAVVHLLGDPSLDRLVGFLRTNLRIGVVSALLNLFWILPLGLFYLRASPTPGGYLMTVENVASLSRKSSMLRALNLRSGLGMKGLVEGGFAASYETGFAVLDQVWPAVGLGLVVVGAAALLSESEHCRRDRLAFGALAVVGAVLLTGAEPPLGGLYRRAALELPMGWMLRDPYKFGGLFTFALAGLVGLAAAQALTILGALRERTDPLVTSTTAAGLDVHVTVVRRRVGRFLTSDTLSVATVVVLLVATSFHGWPIFSGDVNGHFRPTEVPEGYERALEDVSGLDDDGRVLWLPSDYLSVENPRVFKYQWTDRTRKAYVRGNGFLEFSTPGTVMPHTPSNRMLQLWLQERLRNGELDDPSAVLRGVGVRYVVAHTAVTVGTDAPEVLAAVRADPDVSTVSSYDISSDGETYGEIQVLEVRDAGRFAAVPAVEAYDVDDLDPLYGLDGGAAGRGAPVAVSFESNVSDRSGVVTSGEAAPLYLDVGTQLAPYGQLDRHAPQVAWSKAQPHEPWQGRWHNYLARQGTETWQTDHGYGFAFTWREQAVPRRVTPSEADRIDQWRFPGSMPAPGWETLDSEQTMEVDDGHLKLTLEESSYGWKRVASPAVDVDRTGVYRFEFDVSAVHGHSVHAKVAEYDADGELVHVERVVDLGSGNFTRRGVSVDYVPRDPSTTALRLQVWHGHQTTRPLPNEIRLDNVRVYDVTRHAESVDVRIPFTVEESGEYRLFARYLANERGGRMRVTVDGESVPVDTRASFNRLVWEEITTRELEAGRHTLVLENVYGFNAVNVFTLARTEALERRSDRVARALENRTVLYLFDATRDLRREFTRERATPSDEPGRSLELQPGGRAWREFEVMKPGWYRVATRGAGAYRLHVDDRTYPFESFETVTRRTYIIDGTAGSVEVTPVSNATGGEVADWDVPAVVETRENATVNETSYRPVFLDRGTHRVAVTPVSRTVAALGFEDALGFEGDGLPEARAGFETAGSIVAHSGERSLRIVADTDVTGWSRARTDSFEVSPGREYTVVTHTRQWNAEGSHVLLEGYDPSIGEWQRLGRLSDGTSGTTDWRTHRATVQVPDGVERVRFVLNAGGSVDEDDGPGVTWFDDFELRVTRENAIESIRLYSPADGERLGEFVSPQTDTATVLGYERKNPTRYRVLVNSTSPYVLSFGEGYDSLWVAEVDTPNGTERYGSTPLYGAVNGFRIDRTGAHVVTVRYRPQRWANYGAGVSVASLLGLLGVIVYGRRHRMTGAWARRAGRSDDPMVAVEDIRGRLGGTERLHDLRERIQETDALAGLRERLRDR